MRLKFDYFFGSSQACEANICVYTVAALDFIDSAELDESLQRVGFPNFFLCKTSVVPLVIAN